MASVLVRACNAGYEIVRLARVCRATSALNIKHISRTTNIGVYRHDRISCAVCAYCILKRVWGDSSVNHILAGHKDARPSPLSANSIFFVFFCTCVCDLCWDVCMLMLFVNDGARSK